MEVTCTDAHSTDELWTLVGVGGNCNEEIYSRFLQRLASLAEHVDVHPRKQFYSYITRSLYAIDLLQGSCVDLLPLSELSNDMLCHLRRGRVIAFGRSSQFTSWNVEWALLSAKVKEWFTSHESCVLLPVLFENTLVTVLRILREGIPKKLRTLCCFLREYVYESCRTNGKLTLVGRVVHQEEGPEEEAIYVKVLMKLENVCGAPVPEFDYYYFTQTRNKVLMVLDGNIMRILDTMSDCFQYMSLLSKATQERLYIVLVS